MTFFEEVRGLLAIGNARAAPLTADTGGFDARCAPKLSAYVRRWPKKHKSSKTVHPRGS
jgi:hypothetical protein